MKKESHIMPAFKIRGVVFDPPLFCAPMAGITHSAFRRLVSDFGGYGALFTEMLSAKMTLAENLKNSPWLKRRPHEKKLIYQLLVFDTDRLPEILERIVSLNPDGIDLNCACPAPTICQQKGGAYLFKDKKRLKDVVRMMRRHIDGLFTVKIRLGSLKDEQWRGELRERLRLLEDEGVDALIIHPRFTEERFKRSARHSLYAELTRETKLPVIASGDIQSRAYYEEHKELFQPTSGLMIGRMAVVRPWFFAQWHDPELKVDLPEVWNRLCDYIEEDFSPRKALPRIKIIAPYFARNYLYGHTFAMQVQRSPDIATVRKRADDFMADSKQLSSHISLGGLK